MPPRKVSTTGFWSSVERASRAAELHGARFDGDTPQRRLRRMAESVVDPAAFNAAYLPHYFREAPSPAHALLYLGLAHEERLAVRIPRGCGKTVVISFAYTLHQVVCAGVLRALRQGTLATSHAELAGAIEVVIAERQAARDAAPPPTCRALGLPEHWDLDVERGLDAWLARVWRRPVREGLRWDPYIQLIGLSLDAAADITGAIRLELEGNALIRSDWGDLAPVYTGDWARAKRRAASEGDWESNGTRVRAFGMGEGIRGGRHGAYRPTLAVFDDPDSEEASRTAAQRDSNAKKITTAVSYGLEPIGGRVMVIGTPHHPDCVVCRLTEHDAYRARWVAVRFRISDESGRLLFGARWPADVLVAQRAEDPDGYDSELGDRPPALGGRPFRTIHTYSRAAFAGLPLAKSLAFDPALGRTQNSDFQALICLRGPTAEGKILVHRAELLRIADPQQLVERVNAIYAEERPERAFVEGIGFQAIVESLLVGNGVQTRIFPGWERIAQQHESKDARVRGLAPLINAGILLFPDDQSCRQLERQFLDWGDRGAKRDGPDATEMALRGIRRAGASATPHAMRHRRREDRRSEHERRDWRRPPADDGGVRGSGRAQ